ncbi:MAG: DUF4116 domain-containing protein [Desulfovibrio sp.]|nr:DUF4116 domain-containing protein [Desulfovibrio sp.]
MEQDPKLLKLVPYWMREPSLCLEAVRRDGSVLAWVPSENKTREVCLEAVRQNAGAMADVPKNLLTAEMYAAALKHEVDASEILAKRSRVVALVQGLGKKGTKSKGSACAEKGGKLSKEECLKAVQIDGLYLRLFPEWQGDYDVCNAAVSRNGMALEFVPERLKTFDLCILAIKRDKRARQFTPDSYHLKGNADEDEDEE